MSHEEMRYNERFDFCFFFVEELSPCYTCFMVHCAALIILVLVTKLK